jgi:chaperonin GroES
MAYYQATERKKAPALEKTLAKLLAFESSQNIAEMLLEEDDGQERLQKIAMEVDRKYKIDKDSRAEWEEMSKRAMDLALQVRQPKNYPFEKAANVKYPLITVAALQFGARAYPAIIDGLRIVKGQVIGSDAGVPMKDDNGDPKLDPLSGEPLWIKKPGDKRAKADRVSKHMSYQLLNEMPEWEEDTDILIHHLPIVGCAFRKAWRAETMDRNRSEMVPAKHLIVNNKCRSLEEAPAVTHEIFLYPQDIEERKLSGLWLDIELPCGSDEDSDEDAPQMFLEQHRYLDLDGDGYKEPYIVTTHKDSCQVVRIVANFGMENVKDNGKRIVRIQKDQYFIKYTFIPDPKGGFYGIGFGQLLESIGETIDTTLNQMLDAGHLAVAGGGFIGTGIRLKKGGQIKVSPGKFEQVEVSGDIRTQVLPHQFAEPSPVLFQLLGMMVEAAKDITAVKDILTGDTNGQTQTATTTLAMIEQGLKVFTAIYKRIYRALKDEYKLLFKLNAKYIDEQTYYTFQDQEEAVEKSDYDLKSMDICPVADPKMVTDMQRMTHAQLLMQIQEHPVFGALQNPQEALRRVYEAAGTEEPEKLIVKQQGPSEAEKLQMAELESKTMNNMAGAEQKAAAAEKTKVETSLLPRQADADVTDTLAGAQKTMMETALAPADMQQQAHARDMDDAHRDKDRDQAKVEAAEDRAMGREQMEAKAKEKKKEPA